MSVSIYNTLSQKKEKFIPLNDKKVSMYVCGPTVYDYLHVGNFRGSVFFNLVRNWLEESGFEVTYVFNYTDVDDKIIEASVRESLSAEDVAQKYIEAFEEDYKCLELRPHDHNPRITSFMKEIVEFIEDLIKKEKAYVVKTDYGQDVLFNVKSFQGYGKLSKKNIDDLEAGVRIKVESWKKHSCDFALWKSAKPGEPSWPSPWGAGRPGWHIECSTMSQALLGDEIDIHGGGLDLTFPHHENEIAQSEARTEKTFVKYWMHHNMLDLRGEKMSKSLGNLVKGRDFFKKYDPEIYKYMILSSHYRSVIDFSEEQIHGTIQKLSRIYSALRQSKISQKTDKNFDELLKETDLNFNKALNDDFNTVEALACTFSLIREFNKLPTKSHSFYLWLQKKGSLMSLFQKDPDEYLKFLDDFLLKEKNLNRLEIDELVKKRIQARRDKNYVLSDEIRDQLNEMEILVQDTKEGTLWEVKK